MRRTIHQSDTWRSSGHTAVEAAPIGQRLPATRPDPAFTISMRVHWDGCNRGVVRDVAAGSAASVPATGNATTLRDLSRAAGHVIDLSAIDAIAGTVADNPFSFIGTEAFSGVAGQPRWSDLGTQRLIQDDVNGDSTAELATFVKVAGPIDANWFVL